ncbi:MAG: TAT-variant-translocated molybdopterin oxidoreductase [Betaproteobacteria bacterium]
MTTRDSETGTGGGNPQTRRFWRTIDELADDPAFHAELCREYPSQAEAIIDPVQRRTFLKLMGASLALAGFTACTKQPPEKIVPYVRQPEDLVLGQPLFFATAMPLGGAATGLLVESHEGRPTKVEGNPGHPGSLGATDVFAQAATLQLYDPDRSQTLTHLGDIRPWSAFIGAMRAVLNAQQPLKGAGLRLLTESISSPTLAAQIRDLLAAYPSARWHQWDPASRDMVRAGARLAFGEYVETQYKIEQADVILSLDADFLSSGPGRLRYAREFARRRRPGQPERMNRLYALESMPTSTGSKADHRLPLRPTEIELAARRIAAAIGISEADAGGSAAFSGASAGAVQKWIEAIAADLKAHRGSSLVIAGDEQRPVVHALAHAMNAALGNAGRTVVYTDPVEAEPTDQAASLEALVADMNAGKVDVLVILGGNPVYTAPVDAGFATAMSKVELRVHLSQFQDETSALCHWHVPEAHFLESWSDARAYDGTVSIIQPLIAPLYEGKNAHEVLAAMSDHPERSAYDMLRTFWNAQFRNGSVAPQLAPFSFAATPTPSSPTASAGGPPAGPGGTPTTAPGGARVTTEAPTQPSAGGALQPDFEAHWRRWLHDGFVPGTALPARQVAVKAGVLAQVPRPAPNAGGLEVIFRNDPSVLDGRYANNGWLQELPKPITRLTWDNAVFLSPATAERLKVGGSVAFQGGEHGQIKSAVVELRLRGRMVRGAVFVVAGHPDDAATVFLGYGRTRAGQIGTGCGFDANAIRSIQAPWSDSGLQIVDTGDTYSLACTQYHHLMEGRGQIRAVTRDQWIKDPRSVREGDETPPRTLTLYPDYAYSGYKWGMAIDVNACIGCNACVIGCQAENNIPVVGKDQVMRGREMHWLRIDTYYRGPQEAPETYFQPVPCMQCENAPCELVCPVGATVHSAEGLNDMVYNRCVGTRYCSNNCPYKVRRFNFLLYSDWTTPSLKLARNPDVTVRSRGVMEKCTYCVQRINAAKIESEKENRKVVDGEIQTACQAVCPAEAIVFGDLNDPKSRVAQLQAEIRNYSLLGELNTRPRTTYLAAVRNVNPEIGEEAS